MATPLSIAVVAEKPSVARDIARVLGAGTRGEGFLHGNGYVVTWAIGHLVALAQPHEIRPEWKWWRRETLPMLPESWPLVVSEQTKDQFDVVRRILTSPRIGSVVCATDAGREGELIFRYIYEAAASDKPVRRLWISSLTPDAIRDGFARLKDGREYDRLADAARGRSRADWLVGMNLSRAYAISTNEEISVGRVQTPTLAMVVDRELAIRNFVPEDYMNVVATFSPGAPEQYQGTWFRAGVEPLDAASKLPADGEEARAVVDRVRTGAAVIEKIERQPKRMAPPLLYDLTELQRHANRLFGFSAQKTLEIAQALYERHKLISYPRTDSRHLSADVAKTLPRVVAAIAPAYAGLLAPGTGERPLGRRFVDDSKVTDHHAIIPTGTRTGSLQPDEGKLYDLVCRRLLSAWHDDFLWSVTTVITLVRSAEAEDRFHSSGTATEQLGWKVLDIGGGKRAPRKKGGEEDAEESPGDEGQVLPPGLAEQQPQQVLDAEAIAKKTRPPKRLTEGTLLTAMETAGKTLDDKELSEAMKENGLGTPATRAQIIEVLLKRGFIERRGKSLEATEKGIRLIGRVHPEVKSPAMTGQWEAYLKRIERGQGELAPFLRGIEDYVRQVVGKVVQAPPAVPPAAPPLPSASPVRMAAAPAQTPVRDLPPVAPGSLAAILRERFGFESFRPNQEEVCRALTSGRDVLLVMPTGSGKSLCYQLPGIALGGTTLVISPLIALMEDQVAKLEQWGFRVDRVHSNRPRQASRDACIRYLAGELDFLFIAPERFRVRGFPEMLAKRKPALIAIDEAHCISQWGHDFRPDYRTIGQHLPALRPAPVIALTATATPLVQNDIASQLGLASSRRFIHGFRRDNIAIEVVKAPNTARSPLVRAILEDPERRPAIVYTPRRRDTETLAEMLSEDFPARAYHAGLDARRREEVQSDFLAGKLDVIVATIAFGMGVDKPDIRTVIHTALPGSVEGYYQEIGRAGRDGLPSRAILMHAYQDRFTHDWFFERDYPEPGVLAGIFAALTADPQPKELVQSRSRVTGEAFDIALEKLWIHGGASVDADDNLCRGHERWRELYEAQREYKMAQFEKMLSFCESAACRMLSLVRYFGDTADSRRRCGICDFCHADSAVAQSWRAATGSERAAIETILAALDGRDGTTAGKLWNAAFPGGSPDRHAFEELLNAMARCGLVKLADASFEKDGKVIAYRKVWTEPAGLEPGAAQSVKMPEEIAAPARARKRKSKAAAKRPSRSGAAAKSAKAAQAEPPAPAVSRARPAPANAEVVEKVLKSWRLAEARKLGVPAFRIMSDKTLRAVAGIQPRNAQELIAVPGMGLKAVEKYGSQIFRILASVHP